MDIVEKKDVCNSYTVKIISLFLEIMKFLWKTIDETILGI